MEALFFSGMVHFASQIHQDFFVDLAILTERSK